MFHNKLLGFSTILMASTVEEITNTIKDVANNPEAVAISSLASFGLYGIVSDIKSIRTARLAFVEPPMLIMAGCVLAVGGLIKLAIWRKGL